MNTLELPANVLSPVEETHFLSDLLPYDPAVKTGNRLKDGLNEYLLLLIATEQAIASLKARDLQSFDPLVGENACQIRAVKIALTISSGHLDLDSLLNRTSQAKEIIESTLSRLSSINTKKISLKMILDKESVSIELHADEYFLIKSYILTRTKESRPFDPEKPLVLNERTDRKKVRDIHAVGCLFSNNFVAFLREKLSESSVAFVKKLSKQSNLDTKVKAALENFGEVHKGLHCLPYYWTTRVLLEKALQHNIPIVLLARQRAKDRNYKVVQKATLFFQATPQGYQETKRSSLDLSEPALVLLGSSCQEFSLLPDKEIWIKDLVKYGPTDLVLAHAAAHRQYPDESKDYLTEALEDPTYQHYKIKSCEWGCSLENPSFFFLTHAFCDAIENIVE